MDDVSSEHGEVSFRYEFVFKDGSRKEITLVLDPRTLELQKPSLNPLPDWTRLTHHQCPNCPLEPATHPHCPVAVSIAESIATFGDFVSHEEVSVRVHAQARTYATETSLQKGLSSLMGICMTSSGCPIMDRLRPMVATHLPFATFEETTYRMMSTYLLGQYFLAKRGKAPDWGLERLHDFVKEINTVNQSFGRRLASAASRDAATNALTLLAGSGKWFTWSLGAEDLERWEKIFIASYE